MTLLGIDVFCVTAVIFCVSLAFFQHEKELNQTKERQRNLSDLSETDHDAMEDQKAWIQMEGTAIDQPVMQGKDNLEYLHKDPYGHGAPEGSLFLDARCDADFRDSYALIYGHHMENHLMFGDLDLYRKKDFFLSHDSGRLWISGYSTPLHVIGLMEVKEDDEWIFDPEKAETDGSSFLNYCRQHSSQRREDAWTMTDNENSRILALSTCSQERLDERLIILCVWQDERNCYNETAQEVNSQ